MVKEGDCRVQRVESWGSLWPSNLPIHQPSKLPIVEEAILRRRVAVAENGEVETLEIAQRTAGNSASFPG